MTRDVARAMGLTFTSDTPDDQELAIEIRRSGRVLLDKGVRVDMQDYIELIPDLERQRLALDAAIDIALRSLSNGPEISDNAIAELAGRYPQLADAIHDAAALSTALWSTDLAETAAHDPEPRALPQQFGPRFGDNGQRYELRELLGSGTSADVYRAIDRKLSEEGRTAEVAIKVLRGRLTDVVARRRMLEEAARARSITHPSIVQVYDIDETLDGECYIVQELILGGDLRGWREAHADSLSGRDAARLLASLARGVQAIHSQGLVHLDLKPANVLMTPDGAAKLSDFGLATWQSEQEGIPGTRRGTPAFMPPEQFAGSVEATSPRADVYALGGILHWLLTGELPNGDTLRDVEATHASGERRDGPLRDAVRRRIADEDLAAICARALEPRPDLRFDSAGELAESLELWGSHQPIPWRRPSLARSLRLYARRRPLLLTMQILTAALLIAAAIAADQARRFSSLAHAEAIQAEANATLLEAEKKWKASAKGLLREYLDLMIEAKEEGLVGEVLTSLWILEWVYGPVVLNDASDYRELWAERVEVLEKLLVERRAESGPRSHAVMELEYILAYWHLNLGNYEQSEALIASGMPYWNERLDPGDPWLRDMEMVRLCAQVDRLSAERDPADFVGQTRADAIAIERTLRDDYVRLSERSDGAPLARIAIQRLKNLYSDNMLASRPWYEWAVGQEGVIERQSTHTRGDR